MSAYEKFVEQAAEVAYNSGAVVWWWDQLTPNERQPRIDRMRAALDVVGPLIAEDTRDRMVAAAKVAVEREGGSHTPDIAAIRKLHAADFVPQPSQFHAWCTECTCPWPCTTAKILDAEREVEAARLMTGSNEEYGLRTCCPTPIAGPHAIVCLVGRGMLVDPEPTP